jgi:hypothetical protein
LLAVIATLIVLIRRRFQRNAYRRQALRQLQALHLQFQADGDDAVFLRQTNALLKSVAMYAYPKADVAGQHGEAWRQLLNRSLPEPAQFPRDFDNAMYQKDPPEIDIAHLHQAAMHWIKSHRVSS